MAGADGDRHAATARSGNGIGLEIAVALLTTGVSNTMTAGAAVAVLGPVVLKTARRGRADPIIIGFITAISSAFGYLTACGPAGVHHHLCAQAISGARIS